MNVNSAKDESVIEVYMTPWKCSPVMVVVVDGIDRPPLMQPVWESRQIFEVL